MDTEQEVSETGLIYSDKGDLSVGWSSLLGALLGLMAGLMLMQISALRLEDPFLFVMLCCIIGFGFFGFAAGAVNLVIKAIMTQGSEAGQ